MLYSYVAVHTNAKGGVQSNFIQVRHFFHFISHNYLYQKSKYKTTDQDRLLATEISPGDQVSSLSSAVIWLTEVWRRLC